MSDARLLSDRVAVVTGAGRGIGRLIASRFAREGARVALLSRSEGPLRATEAEIRASGAEVVGVVTDVADRGQVEAAFGRVTDDLGPPVIVVNCAQSWGLPDNPPVDVPHTPLERISDAEWVHTFHSGLMGSFYCMIAAFPSMRARGWGRIINFSSPMAAQVVPGFAAYSATKAAIVSLTKTAAREWGRYGITANCLSPIVIDDGQRNRLTAIQDDGERQRAEDRLSATLCVPRDVDSAEGVLATALFLASDNSAFITGSLVEANGGFSLGTS